MALRINKDTITHIKIEDFKKTKFIWCNEKQIKFLWLFNDGKYEEGYWENGKQSNWTPKLNATENYVDRDGILFEKPVIKIYVQDCLICKKYFEDLITAKNYCKNKFPNINVTFNRDEE